MASGHMFYIHTYFGHGGHIYIHSLLEWPVKFLTFLEQLAHISIQLCMLSVALLDWDSKIC